MVMALWQNSMPSPSPTALSQLILTQEPITWGPGQSSPHPNTHPCTSEFMGTPRLHSLCPVSLDCRRVGG